LLEARDMSKTFPGVRALDRVSLKVERGEIRALVGENGAGKSTLVKIITGIYQPDSGEVFLDGQPLRCRSFRDALDSGIHLVSQEIQVIPQASIAENIMLDKMITRGRTGVINWREVHRVASRYMAMVGLDLPPTEPVGPLSPAHKQLTQIAKSLASRARLLLLDEPTSSLTSHEAENLFAILRRIRDEEGVTIIFVSHKLEEVFGLADAVSVLRDGRHVATRPVAEVSHEAVVEMMIGRSCRDEHLGALAVDYGCEVLRADHVSRAGKVRDVTFALHQGEILGFYGLVGSGRTELARILIGEDQPDSGTISVRGRPARIRSVADALYRHRIGYVTENRKEEGLFLDSPVLTNITITVWNRLAGKLTRRVSRRAELDIGYRMVRDLDIRTADLGQRVEELSGGNQQKVSLAKWLAADCDILIVDEPTVGVDVGAKEQIHQVIHDLAARHGKSIILISSDMPEIVRLATRILVFREGRIAGEVCDVDRKSYEQVSAAIGRLLA